MADNALPLITKPEAELLDIHYKLLGIIGIIKVHLPEKERQFLVEATRCLFKGYYLFDKQAKEHFLKAGFTKATINTYKGILLDKQLIYEETVIRPEQERRLLQVKLIPELLTAFKTTEGYSMPYTVKYGFQLQLQS